MKLISKCLFFALLMCCYLSADNASTEEVPKQSTKLFVRVLLEEKPVEDLQSWAISSENGLLILDLENQSRKLISQDIQIGVKDKTIFVIDDKEPILEGVKFVHVISKDGYICANKTWYQGSLLVCIDETKNRALLINSIDLEDYLFSVIKSEGWPGWPVEVNKVLAITSRSYVISKVLEAQQAGRLYHIKNTNAHQRYNGYHETLEIKKAVEETRDIFLAYDGQPILAMFDICCGGVIPAKKKGIHFGQAPYLARSYPCTYCKNYKVFNWTTEYSVSDLEDILKKEVPQLRKLREIKVTKKDDAGIVQQIALKAASGYHYITGKKVYSLTKKIKSLCFSLEKKAHKFIFKGKGFGHHMGLCQWGARRMVDEGWTWDRILQFYYPGTSFMRLTVPAQETYA